jgi:hypothetical protein
MTRKPTDVINEQNLCLDREIPSLGFYSVQSEGLSFTLIERKQNEEKSEHVGSNLNSRPCL